MSASAPRVILLRRPPVLAMTAEPFVPDQVTLDEVDERWAALQERNPAFFDGRLCHVLGVHRNGYGGATLHLADCAYRFHAVQDEDFDLGVRALGVKGITCCDDRVLFGRRAGWVGYYPGQWEFAPSGSVDPGHAPVDVLTRELREETGYVPSGGPVPIALLYDDTIRCWEVVCRLSVVGDPVDEPTTEYVETRWCRRGAFPTDLTPIAQRMVPHVPELS